MLATEVQRTSGFIPVKTVPRLHVAVNEKVKGDTHSKQQTSALQKAAAVCFINTYLRVRSFHVKSTQKYAYPNRFE